MRTLRRPMFRMGGAAEGISGINCGATSANSLCGDEKAKNYIVHKCGLEGKTLPPCEQNAMPWVGSIALLLLQTVRESGIMQIHEEQKTPPPEHEFDFL